MKKFDKENLINMCTTAMYMWEGLLGIHEGDQLRGGSGIFDAWGCGAMELGMALSEYAVFSEEELGRRNPEDYPGVYDYEVSEPFGAWYAKHIIDNEGSAPELCKGIEELKRRMDYFFDSPKIHY